MTPEQEVRVAAAAIQGKPLVIAGVPYEAAVTSGRPPGVWVVHYLDRSAAWVFADEIDALRCGVEKTAYVAFWPFGAELGEIPL